MHMCDLIKRKKMPMSLTYQKLMYQLNEVYHKQFDHKDSIPIGAFERIYPQINWPSNTKMYIDP